jgi:reductive dehalogenase
MAIESPEEMSTEIKGLSKLFGADLVGIAEYDERWVYTNAYSRRRQETRPNEDFSGVRHVIVLGHAMDYELLKSYPSATASAAVGHGYSSEAGTGIQLSQYIRSLGYRASASMNDTALVVPYAIKAGLGEFGRHNMVITPEFGPRVRFSKIFTDLPLVNDTPIRFGVKEFCEICERCSSACPPRAIAAGPPTAEIPNRSNMIGVRKWQLDAEKCFTYWTNLGSDCGVCIRVCPFNKDFSRRIMRIARRLAGTPLRRLILKLDIWFGYGRREAPKSWWKLIRSR